MAKIAHSIAYQTDPLFIIERDRAFVIMRPSYVGTSWPDIEMIGVIGCGRELAMDAGYRAHWGRRGGAERARLVRWR